MNFTEFVNNFVENTQNDLDKLFSKSDDTHKEMTSLYEWTDIINQECTYDEKLKIIGYMWQVAFTDSRIDKYEDYTIRKVSDLIHVKHADFMKLKQLNSTSI